MGRRKITRGPHVDLKRHYRLTLELALVIVLAGAVGVVRAPISGGPDSEDFVLAQQEVVRMEEIQQTKQPERPPAPPRPPIPVEVPNDEVLEDQVLDLDVSLDLDAEVALPPPPPPPPAEEAERMPEPEIFVIVESMPEIIGGAGKVYEYLEYPEIARLAGLEGLTVIQLVVEPDGTPSNLQVARSSAPLLDQAAMRAVSQVRFRPGKQRGKAVRVRMAIPIRFRLRETRSGGTP